ncbi:MAG: phosphoribosylglycinamide formyltransferase-1 [Alphaproteobacteria bacterium]|jgi:phosphoribosylglycinamide formyltransferase-1
MERLKTGVLISGSGTNLQALIDAARAPDYPAEISLVISNKAEAQGLERANKAGILTRIIRHTDYNGRAAFDAALDDALRAAGCDMICLAGFMRILSSSFVEGWRGRMINIHPSLLPAFRGLDAQGQALAAGAKLSGATVHFVVPEMDAGPIIAQGAVPVLDGDDTARLAKRIQAVEHRIYPLALRLIGANRTRIDGNRVIIDGELDSSNHALLSPDEEG